MLFSTLKKTALASMVGFSSLFAVAQDDMPAKGQVQSMITLPVQDVFNAKTVYEAQGAALKDFTLKGWRFNKKANFLTVKNYGSNANYQAVSPEIAVPVLADGEQMYFSITEDFSLESDYDYGKVKISADGGKTWRTVHGVTGQSDIRTAQVNVSSFAGKTIQIALELTSDDSFESTGWNVFGLNLQTGVTSFATTTPASLQDARATVEKKIEILGAQDENFPERVFVDFQYYKDNNIATDLKFTDFVFDFKYSQTEKDLGDCTPELYEPDEIDREIDIMFILDYSGSMTEEHTQLRDNIADFVNSINDERVNVGLIRFGHNSGSYTNSDAYHQMFKPTVEGVQKNFTPDPADFITMLNQYPATLGGGEYGYEAMKHALTANFRENSQKIFIMITDENVDFDWQCNPNAGENFGGTTKEEIIADLQQEGVTVYSFLPSLSCFDNTYANVSDQTAGQRYDIYASFDDLLNKIKTEIEGTYVLSYCPAHTDLENPVEHTVKISLKLDKTVVATHTYTPDPDNEFLNRSETTISHGNESHANDEPLELCFIAYDNKGEKATSMTLWGRTVGTNDDFAPYTMASTVLSDDETQWCVTIPADDLFEPGFEYYAIATYSDGHELKSPSLEEEFFAWTQAVWPNLPPVITMTNVPTIATACGQYYIDFDVSDYTNSVSEITVMSRQVGVAGFTEAWKLLPNTSLYKATEVPITVKSLNGAEYYIIAKDNYGVYAHEGTELNPIKINADQYAVFPTSKSMTLDFSKTELNCAALLPGDEIFALYENKCGKFSVAGKHVVTASSMSMTVYGADNGMFEYVNGYEEDVEMTIYIVRDGVMHQVSGYDYATGTTVEIEESIDPDYVLNLMGDGVAISIDASNPNVPSTFDGTDFGSQIAEVTHTFELSSTSCPSNPVTLDDAVISNTTDFFVDIVGNDVLVTYYGNNDASAVVTVVTSAYDFEFNVKGTKLDCPERVLFGTTDITGDVTPSVAEGTDFGLVSSSTTQEFTFVSDCGESIEKPSILDAGFSVAYSGNTIYVTYDGLADAYGTVQVKSTSGATYEFDVKGQADICVWEVEYAGVTIVNGDASPSVAEGTDFGAANGAVTRSFSIESSGCNVTINAISPTNPEFTYSFSGNTFDITYSGAVDASGTIVVITDKGAYTFDVTGTAGGSVCTWVKYGFGKADLPGSTINIGSGTIFYATLPTPDQFTAELYVLNGAFVKSYANWTAQGEQGVWVPASDLGSGLHSLVITRGTEQCSITITK